MHANLKYKLIRLIIMKLFYKYDFLSRLLQTKKLKKRQVIDVLGNNDYFSLNQWLSGRVPVNINGIIKICNHFTIVR